MFKGWDKCLKDGINGLIMENCCRINFPLILTWKTFWEENLNLNSRNERNWIKSLY